MSTYTSNPLVDRVHPQFNPQDSWSLFHPEVTPYGLVILLLDLNCLAVSATGTRTARFLLLSRTRSQTISSA